MTEDTNAAKELHSIKGVEDVMRKNAQANVDYSKETRLLLRNMEAKIATLEGLVMTNNALVAHMQQQIGILHARTLGGGPTG